MAFSPRAVVVASIAALLVAVVAEGYHGEFTASYYDKTCPDAQNIVRTVMERSVAANPRMAPAILRLFFHDCFVNGCDASVLLNSTDSMPSEKDELPNASLAGFDVVDKIKEELEKKCPATVSCADVLALASRDAVAMLGGPNWSVLLGRKDSLYVAKNATEELPDPKGDLEQLRDMFGKHGLDERDLTALSGAHSVGKAHSCDNFRERIDGYGYDDIDPSYAAQLRRSCEPNCDEAAGVPFDQRTPMKFDTLYYQDLLAKRGLLATDQALYAQGSFAGELVLTYSRNQEAFFADFVTAMVKMGNILPEPWTPAEVRLKCSVANGRY
ncbi:peroxidase 2-like [Oryza brachyantha]|uniref:peroxidase 2-like n=1 Tax=Oryza brachyantha TaxID=4533 RepID=UPI001ADC39C4|nr:peroxidase 2-like [Oryza brachyantha]